jgi:hypothetical protein
MAEPGEPSGKRQAPSVEAAELQVPAYPGEQETEETTQGSFRFERLPLTASPFAVPRPPPPPQHSTLNTQPPRQTTGPPSPEELAKMPWLWQGAYNH